MVLPSRPGFLQFDTVQTDDELLGFCFRGNAAPRRQLVHSLGQPGCQPLHDLGARQTRSPLTLSKKVVR